MLNQKVRMFQVAEHTFHCQTCGATKELVQYPMLRQRLVFLPESLVLLMLSFGWAAFKFTEPLLLSLPIPALISPFVLAAYFFIGFRIIFGGAKITK